MRSSYVTVEHVVGNNLYALSASLIFWQVFRQNMRRWLWEPPSLAQVAGGREGLGKPMMGTHSRLPIGKQEHLKRFYELIRKPIKYFNQIKSVCAPPLDEFCKLVFIVPHRRHSWLFPTPHFPRQLPAIQTDDNDFLYFGVVVWLLIQSVKSLPLKWWLLQIASIK